MCQAHSHLRAFTRALPCLMCFFPPDLHMSTRVGDLCRHRAPCLEGPCACFNVLPLSSEILNTFEQEAPSFHFVLDPTNYAAGLVHMAPLLFASFKSLLVSSLQRGLFWIPGLKLQPRPQPSIPYSIPGCVFLHSMSLSIILHVLLFSLLSALYEGKGFCLFVHSYITPVVRKVPGTESCPISIC